MVALPGRLPAALTGALTEDYGPARPLAHAEAAALVVPHPVLVQVHDASGWEPAWLLACGPDGGDRRYLVQRDGADSSEPQWLAEGQLALPGSRAD